MVVEILKFIIFSLLIVLISKYFLVLLVRKLAELIELNADTVGKIAGGATSVPELLTVCFSAFNGLIDTSLFNIIGSNVLNFSQYILSVLLNKNKKILKNNVIRIDLLLVIFTIIIPIFLYYINFESSINVIPVYILLGVLFAFINRTSYRNFLKKENIEIKGNINNNINNKKSTNIKKRRLYLIFIYSIGLILIGGILYLIGKSLSDVLEDLCFRFNISEMILGLLLGFITSLPELITFFESQNHHSKNDNDELGVIEATNNLLASNFLNLFVIQKIGIIIYSIMFK